MDPLKQVPVIFTTDRSKAELLLWFLNVTYYHGDPTDMRESTSVFQIRTINRSNSIIDKYP